MSTTAHGYNSLGAVSSHPDASNSKTNSQANQRLGEACRERRRLIIVVFMVSTIAALIIFFGKMLKSESSTFVDKRARYLFVFRDAGEAIGLLPVFQQLGADALGIIVPYGTAPISLEREPRVYTLQQIIGRNHYVDDPLLSERNTTLPSTVIETVFSSIPNARGIVTGLVSAPQIQFAVHAKYHSTRAGTASASKEDPCRRSKSCTIQIYGFDDGIGLSEWRNNTVPASPLWGANSALEQGFLDELWVSAKLIENIVNRSKFMVESLKLRQGRGQPPTRVILTGSPALSTTWPNAVRKAGAGRLGRLRKKLLCKSDSKTRDCGSRVVMVHIFGGYDDPGSPSHEYSNSVRMLARSASELLSAISDKYDRRTVLTFSPHPGASHTGKMEQDIFEEEGAVIVIVKDIASPLLAAVANVTLSHFSTCSVQSLFVGTPHVFFTAPKVPDWDSIASASGLVPVSSNSSTLVSNVLRTNFFFNVSKLDGLVPRHATKRMAARLGQER